MGPVQEPRRMAGRRRSTASRSRTRSPSSQGRKLRIGTKVSLLHRPEIRLRHRPLADVAHPGHQLRGRGDPEFQRRGQRSTPAGPTGSGAASSARASSREWSPTRSPAVMTSTSGRRTSCVSPWAPTSRSYWPPCTSSASSTTRSRTAATFPMPNYSMMNAGVRFWIGQTGIAVSLGVRREHEPPLEPRQQPGSVGRVLSRHLRRLPAAAAARRSSCLPRRRAAAVEEIKIETAAPARPPRRLPRRPRRRRPTRSTSTP